MSVKPVTFRLSNKTMNLISENTKLTPRELKFTSFAESGRLMAERSSLKNLNPAIEILKKWYTTIGEKLGFIEKRYYSFFDGD